MDQERERRESSLEIFAWIRAMLPDHLVDGDTEINEQVAFGITL